MRIGVVGCGYWGSKHIRVLSGLPDVKEIVAVDPIPDNRNAIKSAFPAARLFSDADAALPYIDAAIIATPPRSHAAVALKFLRHGKHILVEKPLATSLADARVLVEEALRRDLTLMVGHTFEFNPAVIELKRRLVRGDLGVVYYIHSSRLNLGLYRSDVNVIWDLVPHDISIANYLLGSVPTAVTAWGSSHASCGIEDLAYVRLEYSEIGVVGYVHVSWLDPKKVREVVVVGSEKMAVYNDLAEERLRIFDRGVRRNDFCSVPHERPLSYRYGDIVSPHIRGDEPLALEDQHFVDCVLDKITPRCDGSRGLSVIAVLEAADRSLRTGGPVELELPDGPAVTDVGGLIAFDIAGVQ